MTSHFVASTCRLDGDAFVSHLKWSKMDSIAAMAVSTVDQNDREAHQVLFVNNAGSYARPMQILAAPAMLYIAWHTHTHCPLASYSQPFPFLFPCPCRCRCPCPCPCQRCMPLATLILKTKHKPLHPIHRRADCQLQHHTRLRSQCFRVAAQRPHSRHRLGGRHGLLLERGRSCASHFLFQQLLAALPRGHRGGVEPQRQEADHWRPEGCSVRLGR